MAPRLMQNSCRTISTATPGWSTNSTCRSRSDAAPQFHERSLRPKDRIGRGRRDGRTFEQSLGALGVGRSAQIVCAARRIGAHHQKPRTGIDALMAGAGRQDHDVAGRYVDLLAFVAAEANRRAAA